MPELKDFSGQIPLIIAIGIFAIVAVKLIPLMLAQRKETRMTELANVKEIQIAEITVRDTEAKARLAQSEATNLLTGQLKASSEVSEELSVFLNRSNELAKRSMGRMDAIEVELSDIRQALSSGQMPKLIERSE